MGPGLAQMGPTTLARLPAGYRPRVSR